MRIDKVILKTVLSTLLAIFVLCGVTVTALAFLYPSTMMELSYNVGLDDASAWFAHRAYNQLDNVFYIGYATQVAIGRDDPEAIENTATNLSPTRGLRSIAPSGIKLRKSKARMRNTFTGNCIRRNTSSAKRPRPWRARLR